MNAHQNAFFEKRPLSNCFSTTRCNTTSMCPMPGIHSDHLNSLSDLPFFTPSSFSGTCTVGVFAVRVLMRSAFSIRLNGFPQKSNHGEIHKLVSGQFSHFAGFVVKRRPVLNYYRPRSKARFKISPNINPLSYHGLSFLATRFPSPSAFPPRILVTALRIHFLGGRNDHYFSVQ